MPSIALRTQPHSFITDQGIPAFAQRIYADVLLTLQSGRTRSLPFVVDTGAPFSVIPWHVWHELGVGWEFWGREFHDESGVVPNALKWDGIDCDFGGLEVAIIDARTGNRSESQILVAKFPRFDIPKSHRVSRPLPLLGMDFLHTNALRLIIDGRGSALVGEFETP